MRQSFIRTVFLTLALIAPLVTAASASADEAAGGAATLEKPAATVIAPDMALSHVGEEATVEFVVAAARKLDDKDVCFLNSREDHREEGNFTAVIFRKAIARFEAEGVANPAEAYLGKTIRVSGMVAERAGQAQIVVESPNQIEVVKATDPVGPDVKDR